MEKKLIYEVFQYTDIESTLTKVADVYSNGCVVSMWRDDEPSRIAREKLSGGDPSKLKELEERDKNARDEYQQYIVDRMLGDIWMRIQECRLPLEKFLTFDDLKNPKISLAEKIKTHKPWGRGYCYDGFDWYHNSRYEAACWALMACGYASRERVEKGMKQYYTAVPYFEEIPPYRSNIDEFSPPLLRDATWVEYVVKYYGEGAAWEYPDNIVENIEKGLAESGNKPFLYIFPLY